MAGNQKKKGGGDLSEKFVFHNLLNPPFSNALGPTYIVGKYCKWSLMNQKTAKVFSGQRLENRNGLNQC